MTRLRWRQVLGRAAEELAAAHLAGRGCRVLAQRFRCRRGEIDLVVRDGAVIAFVEVKARSGGAYGAPTEAVGARKRRRLVAAAGRFLRRRGLRGCPCRFDVVAVEVGRGRAQVTWIRDAFRP